MRKISDKEFIEYVMSFYGPEGLYGKEFFGDGVTVAEVKKALDIRKKHKTLEFHGDSIDREMVRDIMSYNRGDRVKHDWDAEKIVKGNPTHEQHQFTLGRLYFIAEKESRSEEEKEVLKYAFQATKRHQLRRLLYDGGDFSGGLIEFIAYKLSYLIDEESEKFESLKRKKKV